MTLYCYVCMGQKQAGEAYTIMRGYAFCFDHAQQVMADKRTGHPSLDGSAFRRDLQRLIERGRPDSGGER
ncbi:DUF2180 family protein [Nonomuraea sp. MG754425]|uniref:DUF2180 family protein n=1 Tax=Nonomuraea sp. MG754425 TaxID=2570319 RepID=UPI001F32EC58|nr:DUF2180 family protein [Nonomuraea sp. MG754425]MCF6473748.1 DUF2180 family protein [Nonomuraea sp. MG754425]